MFKYPGSLAFDETTNRQVWEETWDDACDVPLYQWLRTSMSAPQTFELPHGQRELRYVGTRSDRTAHFGGEELTVIIGSRSIPETEEMRNADDLWEDEIKFMFIDDDFECQLKIILASDKDDALTQLSNISSMLVSRNIDMSSEHGNLSA